MIKTTSGDIFQDESDALVNTVNCVGVMGRGIALQFKKAYPDNFKEYEKACKAGLVVPGKMFVSETRSLTGPRYIVNFPTKRHWRGKSRIEDIQSGLIDLKRVIEDLQIKSIAIPPLGAGLGGLDWPEVFREITQRLISLEDVRLTIYEPNGTPSAEKMVKNKEVPRMTPGRAALVTLMHRYVEGLLDPMITLIEIHKLMYFMQESGENLKLKYAKAHYGPYAENLKHVLHQIEGHMVSGYSDGGDQPDKELKLVPGAVEDANKILSDCDSTLKHFNRVGELVKGFETPFGLELLATVHWVVTQDDISGLDEVVRSVHGWNSEKQKFTPRQIQISLNRLEEMNWIGPQV